jgi:hypothetical protein
MNDSAKRLLPRVKPQLDPYLIRRELNPFKHRAYTGEFPSQRPVRCKGIFWDATLNRTVIIDLGPVSGLISYRAVPSAVAANLSRVEGTARYEINAFSGEHRPQRSEDGAQAKNGSGSYVIPGQSLTDENKC